MKAQALAVHHQTPNMLPINVFNNVSMGASVKFRKKNICREQSKGKTHPRTGQEGPEGEL
jgi:hypothetical protein